MTAFSKTRRTVGRTLPLKNPDLANRFAGCSIGISVPSVGDICATHLADNAYKYCDHRTGTMIIAHACTADTAP